MIAMRTFRFLLETVLDRKRVLRSRPEVNLRRWLLAQILVLKRVTKGRYKPAPFWKTGQPIENLLWDKADVLKAAQMRASGA
jgi:hypothetical protein